MLRCSWLVALSLCFASSAAAAVFTVTKTSDGNDGVCDADCSVREAVQAANLEPGSTVLVPAGTHRLTLPPPARIANHPGDGSGGNLVVNAPMTITGAGRGATILDARPEGSPQGGDRVLAVFVDGDLALSGVTITGGMLLSQLDQGGGVQVLGGRLALSDSEIVRNVTNGAGGGMVIGHDSETPAVVSIVRSEIAENTSLGGGGGIFTVNNTVSIVDSVIRDNRSVRGGGGGVINMDSGTRFNTPQALLRVLRSTVSGNVSGNPAIDPLVGGIGGGIFNSSGRVEIENSTITGNLVHGVYVEGLGWLPGTGQGGGVAHRLILGDDPADGTFVTNSTIAWNDGPAGAQLYSIPTTGVAELVNTIVAGDGAEPNCGSQGGQVGYASAGGNVGSDASPCQLAHPTDQAGVDPGLAAALADGGGPTPTLALLEGSPALGAGVAARCPARDQRGALRRVPCD
ncbi:MAG: hypothetical protein DCC71_25245, partial [Proteobacteria bacterium]